MVVEREGSSCMDARFSRSVALLLSSTMIARLMLCLFSLDGNLALNWDISSFSVRVWRSLCIDSFDTYQGGEIISWVWLTGSVEWFQYSMCCLTTKVGGLRSRWVSKKRFYTVKVCFPVVVRFFITLNVFLVMNLLLVIRYYCVLR